MQNFTFGRKGTNWFLFAFVLLIGTLPSFGQDCATVVDEDSGEAGNQQSFCYLSTVADIQTSNGTNTAIFETDDTVNDTQPIDSGELLTTGTTYYVGSTTEDCDRVAVTTTVTSPATPDNSLYPGQNSFTLSPCVSSGFSVADLEGLFTADAGSNYVIQAYTTEFGDEIATGDLVPGENYFVAQVSTVSGECPSTRAAVGYDPTEAPAPLADSPQDLCEGATVADLVAEGTEENTQAIRWYRSATSNSPLADDVQLIDGEDYFAAQIVNDRNDPFPPCETPAGDRVRIEVTLQDFNAGADVSETICQSDLQSRLNNGESPTEVFLSYVNVTEDIAEVTFDPPISSIVTDYSSNPFQTFTTDATFTTETGCEDTVEIEVTVVEDFEAGDDNLGNTLCRSDIGDNVTAQSVEDYLTGLLSENADPNGEFSPEPADIANSINSSSDEISFDIVYTVGQGTGCEDTADLQVTILEGVDYELVQLAPLCNDDIPALVNEIPEDVEDLFLANFGENIPEGEFEEGTIQAVINQYNQQNIDTFTATYIAGAANGCNEAIELSRTVIAGQQAEAGNFDNIEDVCTNQDPIDLTSLTNNNPDAISGGTFSGTGVENNQFDPSVGEGVYTITYTVNESVDCVSGSEQTTFTIEVIQGPNAGQDISGPICITELEEIIVSNQGDSQAIINALFERFDFNGDQNGTIQSNLGNDYNTIGAALAAYYLNQDRPSSITIEGQYTVGDPQNVCGVDVSNFSITINDTQDANAGTIPNQEVCVGDEMIDLNDFLIGTDAMAGGTFTGPGVENNMFDPSIGVNQDGYTITYTVDDSSNCVTPGTSDPEDFQIVVLEGRELGEPITDNLCVADLQSTYSVGTVRNYFASLIPNYNSNGSFEPSMSEIADQYNNAESKIGQYQTTYTLGTGDCEDSVLVTVIIEGEINAEAGDDYSTTFCSNEEDQDLYDFLSEDANPNGTFEGYEDGNFSPSELGAGVYSFNYIVNASNACVEGQDTATFTIEVFEAPNAGEDISESLCISEAQDLISSPQEAIDWFNGLVDVEGVNQDGSFDPALETLAAEVFAYVSEPDAPSATFETTYMVANENCEDTAEISLTINNLEQANAGEDVALTFCVSQGEQDLFDYLSEGANPNGYFEDFDGTIDTSELGEGVFTYTYIVDESVDCVTGEESVEFTVTIIGDLNAGADKTASVCNANIEDGMFPNSTSVRDYFLNMLDEGVSREGTFSPSIQDLVNWYNNESEIGDFTTTYTLNEGECSDSTVLTVTVYESIPAEIDPIDDVTLCSIDQDQNLFSFLPEGANTNGFFEGYENGMFSPSTTGAGEFEVTYTLDETSPCVSGEASASFTITVLETVTAGENMTASFCTNQGEQNLFDLLGAEASAEGEFTYNDEILTDGMFNPSTLGEGTYEVIYTVEPINECGVATSTITITVNTAPEAPETAEQVAFCAIDGATAALLEAEGTNLTWYSDADLTMMVSEEDLLVSGEYYVTQSSDEGCESEAAMITVNIVDSPAPTISADYELCEFDNPTLAELTAEINETGEVTWYESADSMTALSDNAMLTDGTTYYATLISDNGCESSERLAVTVTLEDCALLFPEAITPNGDGMNDRFVIENIESEYPNYNITIFNRWGSAVYKGNASVPAWDGTSNQSGSLGDGVLPVGVYFYVVDFNDGSTEPRQGRVYLNR